MKAFLETLKQRVADNSPNYGDADSVLGLLYECFNENNPYDNEQIRADFNELYRQMNGMPLREMDKIVYPVCKLCRDHERLALWRGSRSVSGCSRNWWRIDMNAYEIYNIVPKDGVVKSVHGVILGRRC